MVDGTRGCIYYQGGERIQYIHLGLAGVGLCLPALDITSGHMSRDAAGVGIPGCWHHPEKARGYDCPNLNITASDDAVVTSHARARSLGTWPEPGLHPWRSVGV